MANMAVLPQLPIMVRLSVWPSLAGTDVYLKDIPGDGNCLFAALADQLFTDPARHPEVRKRVIEYMRENRTDYEHYATVEELQTRRPTRGRINAAKNKDKFEEYLTRMSANGTYGGQPELVAFCRAYDRDVVIHRPQGSFENEQKTENDRRSPGAPVVTLHISYGDECTSAHYDSVRRREGEIKERRRAQAKAKSASKRAAVYVEQIEAIRGARPDLLPKDIETFLELSRNDVDFNYQRFLSEHRARSSSISSSQRSSSSKRSLDHDSEPVPAAKRTDRRKSLKKRAIAVVSTTAEHGTEVSFKIRIDSPEPGTPASTQDTEYSSEATGGMPAEGEQQKSRKPAQISGSDLLDKALARLKTQESLAPEAVAVLKHKSLP